MRESNGAFIPINIPGSFGLTEVLVINPAGVIAGDYCNQFTCFVGFLLGANGFTSIDLPGQASCGNGSIPIGINPAGAVVGFTADSSCSVPLAYVRTPDGKITTFGFPDAPSELCCAIEPGNINPAGAITGFYFGVPVSHSFLRAPDGTITTFDVPNAIGNTFALDINPENRITGFFCDAAGCHGFLFIPSTGSGSPMSAVAR